MVANPPSSYSKLFQIKEPLITSSFLLKLLKIPSSDVSGQMFETAFNKLVGPHVLLEKRLAETDKNVKPLSTQTKLSKVRCFVQLLSMNYDDNYCGKTYLYTVKMITKSFHFTE